MIRSQLNSYSGADPIWGFVALISSERYTGAAAVGIDPRIRLFAVDGRVYFAEREGDAPIGTRLVNCGAVSTTQLEHGVVQIGETSSLSRLFQREPSIDRDAVELTIELATESLLASFADKAVGMPEVFPLRHHSSGVHHWMRSASSSAALALPVVEAAPAAPHEPVVEEAPSAEEAVAVEATVEVGETVDVEETFTFDDARVVAEVRAVEETPVVEEQFVMEEVFALEAPTRVDAVVETAVVEAAVVEAAVVETAVVETAVVETAAVAEEAVAEEAVAEAAAVPEAAREEPVIEDVVDEPTTSSFVALTAMSLPTLSSMTEPATDDSVARDLTTEASVTVEAITEELPTEPLRTKEALLAPMPTLASLTLPTLQSAPAPNAAQESTVAGAPTLASTSDDFVSSLPEPATFATTDLYEPAERPTGLPKLASAPISMNDLAIAKAAPASPFGEPTHNLAAVDIWQMVDVLTDDGREGDQQLVGSGSSKKQGRGWLRGRKG